MNSNTHIPNSSTYSQSHRMKLYWWILLLILFGFNLNSINNEIDDKNTTWLESVTPNSDFFDIEYIFIFLVWILVLLLLATTHLKWTISKDRFEYSFFPFIRKKTIDSHSIREIKIIKINPILDFGGWGLRFSRKYGRAYTTSGRYVLHIEFEVNKKLNLTVTEPEIATQEINAILNFQDEDSITN